MQSEILRSISVLDCKYIIQGDHKSLCAPDDYSTALLLTLQRGGFKNPVHTVMWEGFSTGYLNLELNCAGVY